MTAEQETEMHDLAVKLEHATRGTGWEAMRYMAIGQIMNALAEYCRPTAAPSRPEAQREGKP